MGGMLRVLLWICLAPLAVGQSLKNPGFEEGGAPPAGWSVSLGAGQPGVASAVECVGGDTPEGARALRLSGDAATEAWQYVAQRFRPTPGERYGLRFLVRSEDVRQEQGQYASAYVRLRFFDAAGKEIWQEISPGLLGTRPWSPLFLQALAPAEAADAEVALFLSMSGTLEIDALSLEVEPAAPFSEESVRAAAFAAVAGHLRRTYPFFGLPGKPDPDELFERHRADALGATTLEAFADELKQMLDELADLHVHLRLKGEGIFTGPEENPRAPNWNLKAVEKHFAEVVSQGETHVVARLKEGLGYVRLSSFTAEWEELQAADAALDKLADVRGWIVDVRANGGGGEDKGQYFAGRFVGESIPYAQHVFRDPFSPEDPEAFGAAGTRWLTPRRSGSADARPVTVLMGPYCVSSTEGFLLMLQALPNTTLVGQASRGASGNPGAFGILPGLELVSSRWRSLTLAGDCIEGVGVQPDVLVDEHRLRYVSADPTFERALALLADPSTAPLDDDK